MERVHNLHDLFNTAYQRSNKQVESYKEKTNAQSKKIIGTKLFKIQSGSS